MRLRIEGLFEAERSQLTALLAGDEKSAAISVSASDDTVSRAAAPAEGELVLIAFVSPALAAARALAARSDPVEALNEWQRGAEAAARLLDAAPASVASADAILALKDPARFCSRISLRTGVELAAVSVPAPAAEPACLFEQAAERWVRDNQAVMDLLEALDAASLTAGLRRTGLDPKGFEAAAQAWAKIPVDAREQTDTARLHIENEALAEALELCRADLEAACAGAGQKALSSSRALVPVATPSSRSAPVRSLFARLRRGRDLELIRGSDLFDGAWYTERYPDVAKQGEDPALHYLLHGGQEGRPAGPKFSSSAYLDLNPDLKGSHLNPLVHYLRFGREEGRVAVSIEGKPVDPIEDAE
ncbi:hypothetical protein NHF40_02040 [Maricaulaceae bacterium EIL42A08]|nr:hypothetical protein [Maricaulaceae bacterium EIL42A08]